MHDRYIRIRHDVVQVHRELLSSRIGSQGSLIGSLPPFDPLNDMSALRQERTELRRQTGRFNHRSAPPHGVYGRGRRQLIHRVDSRIVRGPVERTCTVQPHKQPVQQQTHKSHQRVKGQPDKNQPRYSHIKKEPRYSPKKRDEKHTQHSTELTRP